MNKEKQYTNNTDTDHIKSYGQYFTPPAAASFMCAWAGADAANMLDPAVGNSIFLTEMKQINPHCRLKGFELDAHILDYFGNPAAAELIHADYLLNDWANKYDAIVCNPPYNRFQSISNRAEILDSIFEHTGVKYSSYTNLYILFLIKSIYQMSEHGKLAYIIPTEFLNSQYGVPIKELLLKNRLLSAVINFQNNDEMFFNATTTCCILLLDHAPKKEVFFYNLSSVDELSYLNIGAPYPHALAVPYVEMTADEKWRSYLNQEQNISCFNLTDVSKFCKVSRGIATGANDFFCMSNSKIQQLQIPAEAITECICRSADVRKPVFSREDYAKLAESDKHVYLLDIPDSCKEFQDSRRFFPDSHRDPLAAYIAQGESQGLSKKYLLSRRIPWYSMEQKDTAPIWVTTACRQGIKFVRNLAGVKSLTTFHSIFVHDAYAEMTDVIFCYFLTPAAQSILRKNRKELGNGLEKFQPGDLKTAKMLDLSIISENDRKKIISIYQEMISNYHVSQIEHLNEIFTKYLYHCL